MMKIHKVLAFLLIALTACVGVIYAADQPAKPAHKSGGAIENAFDFDADDLDASPSVCDRDSRTDPLSMWFDELIHSLCKHDDSDSLLGAYFITLPSLWGHGEADQHLLDRAYAVGKANPKVLWVVAITNDCRPKGTVCQGYQRAIFAAQALTRIDPDNAMSWFALAYATNRDDTPDRANSALRRAAQASRVHDYDFDLLKHAVAISGRIPVPKVALATDGFPSSPELVRWTITGTTPWISALFKKWIIDGCGAENFEKPYERTGLCASARAQFKHGDSLMTLSGDAAAFAGVPADLQGRMPRASWVGGISDEEYAKAIIPAIVESSSERKMYTKLMARLGLKKK